VGEIMKTVEEIIKEYLKANGFDGLFNEEGECACEINDLATCGCIFMDCEPGYRADDPTGDYDFLIVRRKPE
jgi:hypothetical protein